MATTTATTSPYLLSLDTGVQYLFVSVVFATLMLFILYIVYQIKAKDKLLE